MVESPRLGPVVERTGGALHVVGREVPLAEPAGDVAVVAKDAGETGARLRLRRGVARERAGILGDRAEPDPVLVAAGQERSACGGADGGHVEPVVGDPHLTDPAERRCGDGAAEGVGCAVAGVVDEHHQHVGGSCGRGRPGDHRPVGDRVLHRATGDTGERLVGDRQARAVRSELAGGFGQGGLEVGEAVHRCDRMSRRARQRPLGGEAIVGVDQRNDRGGADGQVLAEFLVQLGVDLLLRELADESADSTADDHGAEHRRVEQPDEDADATAPSQALAAEVVGRVGDLDVALGGMFDQDDAVGPDALVGHRRAQRVEVLACGIGGRVRRHQEFEGVAHWEDLSLSVRERRMWKRWTAPSWFIVACARRSGVALVG